MEVFFYFVGREEPLQLNYPDKFAYELRSKMHSSAFQGCAELVADNVTWVINWKQVAYVQFGE